MTRYSRQQQVPVIGSGGQTTLANARVLVVGVGGLGSPVSTLLTGAGVGHLTLVDHDTVSLSNLHRQTLFTESDIGALKVNAAKARLEAVNNEVSIETVPSALSIDNAEALVTDHIVVVDAADSFLVTYLLSDLCFAHRIPLVSASVVMTQGYLGVFCGSTKHPAPSYRAVFPSPPTDAVNCNTVGVTGPSVGIIGSLQAQEVLKVLLDDDAQLRGKVMYLDLWNYRQQIIDISNACEPSKQPGWQSLTQLDKHSVLLDVRTPEEHAEQPLDHAALNIPILELESRLSELEYEQAITCVCRSGQRAMRAAHILLENGFNSVSVAQP